MCLFTRDSVWFCLQIDISPTWKILEQGAFPIIAAVSVDIN